MSASRVCRLLVALGLGLVASRPAFALDPARAIDRYVHRAWTTDQGLPQNAVYAVVASREGYLWLGTDEGLVRFDGLRFVVFDRTNTPALRDTFVFALHEARDGALWVGTDRGGLLRFAQGRFTHIGQAQGLPEGRIQALADGQDGSLWVGIRGGGLARVRGEHVETFSTRDGLWSDNVQAVLEDRAGRLWIGTDAGLDWRQGGRFTHVDAQELPAGGVRALREDRAGRLWVGTVMGLLGARVQGGGLAVRDAGRFSIVSGSWPLPSLGVMDIHEDRGGTLWLGTAGGGIVRVHQGRRPAQWNLTESPADDMVYAIAEDAEGSLWLGTAPGGLHRLRDSLVTTWTTADGLSDDVIESIFQDRQGAIWVGTHAGGFCRVTGSTMSCRSLLHGRAHTRVNAMLDDDDGALWLGTQGGLDRVVGGHATHLGVAQGLPVDHVNALLRDRDGTLWVGTWGGGVARRQAGAGDRFEPVSGVSGPFVTTLLEDARGRIWIGTTDGLFVWQAGRLTNLTAARGLPTAIEALHADRDGGLWIGTRRDGLFRYDDDRLVQITTREGLFDNLVGTILEDGTGHFWFTCNKGLFRVARAQLLAVVEGRSRTVASRAFDTADGMRNRECNFGQGRWRMRDGRLWFATVGGVVAVDPRRLPRNEVPPRVIVERVAVDGEPLPVDRGATLGYGQRRVEFGFVGLSLSAPQRVRYRVQLEGFDPDWEDAGDARVAQYTNLSPGTYRFRVMAANGDGVWSRGDTTFTFTVRGPVWQRAWFIAGLVGLLWLTGVGVGVRRVRIVRREQQQQAAFARELIALQEGERQRLAADLHDGIGQQLLVIKNWARLSMDVLDAPDRARPLLQEIVDTTAQSIREIRTITQDLQPYDLDHVGLPAVLATMLARVAESSGLAVRHEIADVPLSKEAAIHVFRIVQEAMNNVIKHAHASEVRVVLRREAGRVELSVQDNGRGIAEGPAAGGDGGGFGLRSLAERTRLLGGRHDIASGSGGTTVRVVIPCPREAGPHAH